MPQNRWETFARKNAEFYIYPGEGKDFSTPHGRALFFQSGRDSVEWILSETEPYIAGWERAVEIGCGVGRMAVPMAERFREVIGVDISTTMLGKLSMNCREAGVQNVRGFLPDEPWSEQGEVDFIYSLLVFQHIESWDVIAQYFRRSAACLRANGVCYVQIDTRRRNFPYWITCHAPDVVLPRLWRRGIRCVRRRRSDLLELFRSCGLDVIAERRPDSQYHVFILKPAAHVA